MTVNTQIKNNILNRDIKEEWLQDRALSTPGLVINFLESNTLTFLTGGKIMSCSIF